MQKQNLLSWKDASKSVKVNLPTKTVELKEDRSLFARLLIIAKSRPEVNLQKPLGNYEFTCFPGSLFTPEG